MKEARYFYVPNAENECELPADEAAHAARVLRLQNGDEVFLADGAGCFYKARLTVVSKNRCLYEITEKLPQQKTWNGYIHLVMAPTKMSDRVEWMAEKATEIGIDELSFINCAFSERKQLKTERIERIVVSAMKQSRKAWKPVVNEMQPFADFIRQPIAGRKFIAHCYDEIDKTDFFDELNNDAEQTVTILVGPEGDFSIDEVRQAMAQGYKSVSLGKSRLRTETAALSAVMSAQLALRKKD